MDVWVTDTSFRQHYHETKLSEIHAEAASRAGSHADSNNRGPFPIGYPWPQTEKQTDEEGGENLCTSPGPMSSTAGPDSGPCDASS